MITIQKSRKTRVSDADNVKRRVENIIFFASLDRRGLSFNGITKSPVLYNINNEIISFIYPGKESDGWNKWDFRPILKINNSQMKDLSFGEVWKMLDTFVNSFQEEEKQNVIILLSRILYKVAFLQCHDRVNNELYNGTENVNIAEKHIHIFNKNLLNEDECELLSNELESTDINGNPLNISLESFIIYNDLLCCNEDSKYYYREYLDKDKLPKPDNRVPSEILNFDIDIHPKRNIKWSADVGRINTFLTHINVLKTIFDDRDPYDLLYDCAIKRGVFQIKNDEDLITFLNQNIEVI